MTVLRACAYVLAASLLWGGEKSASTLFKEGRKLEKKGDFAGAYLKYAQAAAADPKNTKYWQRSVALRTKAAMASKAAPIPDLDAPAEPASVDPGVLLDALTEKEIDETRKPQPPQELDGDPGLKDQDLRGDSKALWEQVMKSYGLDVVFDGDYQPMPNLRFRMEDATYRDAIHGLMAVTSSFLVPISPKLALVVKDTPQKRAEVENNVAIAIPLPETVVLQEAQELARSVQQLMEIRKFGIDSARRIAVMRDRVSKVAPAIELFRQLLSHRAQIMIEVEFLTVARNSSTRFGLSLPNTFPLVPFGDYGRLKPTIPEAFTNFFVFGGGLSLLGIGITNAELFASMSKATSRSVLSAEVRTLDGQPVQFNVGQKYPIATNLYLGDTSGEGDVFVPPPTFQFEDLGLTLKITPKVHDTEEVTLQVEADFKILGNTSFNGIPVISNRQAKNIVRLRFDQWAIISGLVSSSQARTLSGIAGIASIPLIGPLLSSNTRDEDNGETLLVIKPRLLSLPPSEIVTREIYIGSEGRPRTPL